MAEVDFSGIENNALSDLTKQFPGATRSALERTFKWWLRRRAPLHFQRTAFSQWIKEYSQSSKKDQNEWIRKNLRSYHTQGRKVNPLEKSGGLKKAFLHGSYMITGNNYDMKVKWTGIPDYVFKYANKYKFKVKDAITAISADELKKISEVFEKFLHKEMVRATKTKTKGRIVF